MMHQHSEQQQASPTTATRAGAAAASETADAIRSHCCSNPRKLFSRQPNTTAGSGCAVHAWMVPWVALLMVPWGAPLKSPAMTPQMWDSLRRVPAVAGRGDRRPTLPCAPFARTLPTSASSDPSASSHKQRNVLSLTHSKASGTWSYASSIRQGAIEHGPLPQGLPAKLWQLPARLSLTSPQSTPCEGQGRLWSFLKQVRSIK